jgi:hypothetical protein
MLTKTLSIVYNNFLKAQPEDGSIGTSRNTLLWNVMWIISFNNNNCLFKSCVRSYILYTYILLMHKNKNWPVKVMLFFTSFYCSSRSQDMHKTSNGRMISTVSNELKIKLKRFMPIWDTVQRYASCFVWVWNWISHTARLRVSESMALRKTYEPKSEVLAETWRKLHDRKVNHTCLPRNDILVIKLTRTKWTVYVVIVVERKVRG